jgi:predicted PurR-regulated permease PerM
MIMSSALSSAAPRRGRLTSLVLIVATALGIFLCARLAAPFLPALAWAVALAVLCTPFQGWLEAKLKYPSLAAAVTVLLAGLVLVALASFVGQRLVLQAAKGAELIEAKVMSNEWRKSLEAWPNLTLLADTIEQQFNLPETLKTLTTWLSTTAAAIVKGSVVQAIGFCLTFYLLFFLLRDRRVALHALRALAPLTRPEMDRMISRVNDTIFATIYGTLAVAAIQGCLGGLMFWWLGLSAPLLWGVVMAFLAVIPFLGAFIVWLPAALFLALDGEFGKALLLVLWGMLVVGTIDNLLRPILVGSRLKLHTVLTFMSVVGGLMLFGAAGLILGPVVLTVTTELLDSWTTRRSARPMAASAVPAR